ncbi:unnamed protein product [Linum trigynum]|uniref:Uncharacterized protein n=1 Tax=Linum trigynum TaxID=586398 RepID=A0AAV2DH29_9ROSI
MVIQRRLSAVSSERFSPDTLSLTPAFTIALDWSKNLQSCFCLKIPPLLSAQRSLSRLVLWFISTYFLS